MSEFNQTLFSVEQIVQWTDGMLLQGDATTQIHSVTFDSRKATAQSLFVALVAERDGHTFIPSAIESGTSAVLISDPQYAPPAHIAAIVVEDTLHALGQLAAKYLQEHTCKVVGITGSNGKTTTKEMLGSIMRHVGPTLQTSGNFNNLIGLPSTLFGLRPEHQFVVLEMGMNAPGEIARLAEIAHPSIGAITCVAAAHLEGLGSIEGVARAKGELFSALPSDGTAVINADDPHVLALHKTLHCRKLFFSMRSRAHSALKPETPLVSLESCTSLGVDGFKMDVSRPRPSSSGIGLSHGTSDVFSVHLPLVGKHQVSNALAAISIATALNVPVPAIQAGLSEMVPTGRRMRMVTTSKNIHLLDDCYNSNPHSVRAALQTLKELARDDTKIAVLGDMLELGDNAATAHASIGRCAVALGVQHVFAFGPLSQATAKAAIQAGMPAQNVLHTEDIQELQTALMSALTPGSWVLVKGSRGMRLERISEHLEAN